jgi:lipopolysaccharide transport system ATP-binding protein
MSDIVLKVTDLSKMYRLGEVGTGTISDDLKKWWYNIRGKENPFAKVGESNDRSTKANSDYVLALNDINFEVKKGEILGIIGKNGAGKSTLLKILSKVTGPSTGSISIQGRVASLLEVGTGFHPELTGRENVFLNGTILGMTRKEVANKIDEIVDFSGIRRYLDTPVKRYSSGMTVRLGFAVAAHLEPDILIVDEVLAVGDAEFQSKAIGKMQSVSQNGDRTVLFVSHNLGSVSSLCTRCLYVKNGEIAMSGETDQVIQKYLEDSANENDSKNLLAATNRKGNGVGKVSYIALINPKTGKEVSGVIAGEPLEIHIGYYSELKQIEDLEVALIVTSQLGNFTTVFDNSMANFYFKNVAGKGKLICEIPKMALMFGKFYIKVNVAVNKILTDTLEDAISFTVNEGDYFKSGYPNARNMQGVYMDQSWKIISD